MTDLEEFRRHVTDYAVDPEQVYPYDEWVLPNVSFQLMWYRGDLHALVEVLGDYEHFDSIEMGDSLGDAPGEFGEAAKVFLNALKEGLGESIDVELDYEGPNHQRIPVKMYRRPDILPVEEQVEG